MDLTLDMNVSELCGLVQILMLLYLFLYLVVLYLTLDVSETELCGVFQILMVISLSLSVWCDVAREQWDFLPHLGFQTFNWDSTFFNWCHQTFNWLRRTPGSQLRLVADFWTCIAQGQLICSREDYGFLEQPSLFKLGGKITTCICSKQNLSAGAKWVAEGSNDGTMGGSTTTMGAK